MDTMWPDISPYETVLVIDCDTTFLDGLRRSKVFAHGIINDKDGKLFCKRLIDASDIPPVDYTKVLIRNAEIFDDMRVSDICAIVRSRMNCPIYIVDTNNQVIEELEC